MTMDAAQRGIALLLKSAVTGEPEKLPADFSLEAALELISRHRIIPAVYEGAVRCGVDPGSPVMQGLLRESYFQTIDSEKQLRAAEGIFAAFEKAGIDYMPFKGCNLKHLYPKTALRPMGDADILIRTGQYERIRPVMMELGFEEKLETDHVYLWRSPSLEVELHKCPAPPEDEDLYGYYGDGWRFAVPGKGHRYDLSVEDAYVFLFAHFARHYRFSGIGCRHVLDLFVYRRKFPDMDMAYVEGELAVLGLLSFHRNVERTLAVWFADGPEDPVTELITQFVFASGNWGTLESHSLLQQVKRARERGNAGGNRRQNLKAALFPPLRVMQRQYPLLKKMPLLLPLMWPVRIVQILLFRRKSVRKRRRIVSMITDEKVELYRQLLEAVGLLPED